ncbi:MAG TPA: transcriptional regulator [Chloroflexi bacterium]|nr:transcriptional regulator [Chloroflexota bacterium]
MDQHLLILPESLAAEEFVVATYALRLTGGDPLRAALEVAVTQTTGTWLPIAGESDAHRGRVIALEELPVGETARNLEEGPRLLLARVAFPVVNFGSDLTMLLATLLGNDASASHEIRLLDMELPASLAAALGGPRYGIPGLRQRLGVPKRPLVCAIMKPSTGFALRAGVEACYQAALGGADLIKDDELLADPDFLPLAKRVPAYADAVRRAFEETGHRTRIVANITAGPTRLLDNGRLARDAGADVLMVNLYAVSPGALADLAAADLGLPLWAHSTGAGTYFESPASGMSAHLTLGKVPRLAGADVVILDSPLTYPWRPERFALILRALRAPLHGLRPTLPAAGGGVRPDTVPHLLEICGRNVVLAAGGAVHGHPNGTRAGVEAMRVAVDAAIEGIPLPVAAQTSAPLRAALDAWAPKDR